MRYPVGNGTREDFERNWYSADAWNKWRGSYFHGGEDINLRTGGDSDLGQPIYAISDGVVTSVHEHRTNFGKHLHIKHDGPWGVVYSHYAHCDSISVKAGDAVVEGQKIATLGKTGTNWAHLHFEIKLQPIGVDSVAKTKEDLKKWTDPFAFINKWMGESMPGEIYDVEGVGEVEIPVNKNQLLEIDKFLQQERQRLVDERQKKDDLQSQLDVYKSEYEKEVKDYKARIASSDEAAKEYKSRYKEYVAKLANKLGTTQDEPAQMAELTRLIVVEDELAKLEKERDFYKDEYDVAVEAISRLKQAIKDLETQLKTAKGLHHATDDELLKEYLSRKIDSYKEIIQKLTNILRKS